MVPNRRGRGRRPWPMLGSASTLSYAVLSLTVSLLGHQHFTSPVIEGTREIGVLRALAGVIPARLDLGSPRQNPRRAAHVDPPQAMTYE